MYQISLRLHHVARLTFIKARSHPEVIARVRPSQTWKVASEAGKALSIDMLDGGSALSRQALVALDEKMHFVHECAGLKDKPTEIMFTSAQSKLRLNRLKENLCYWHGCLSLIS